MARIAPSGYRRYEGPRTGTRGAQEALLRASVQRALGLRRKARYKIVPVLVAVMAYLPAAIFVGVSALVPESIAEEVQPDYGGYYGFVSAAIILFVAAVVPDVLCSDRRSGMLSFYLAAPLTRVSYLLMKGAAVLGVLLIVTLGPPVLLLVGFTLLDVGPGWPLEGLGVGVRIVAAGLLVAGWYTVLAMAVSSLTDRRGVATAGVVLVTLASAALVGGLVEGAEVSEWLRLVDLFNLPFEAVQRLYGETGELPGLPTTAIVAAMTAWMALGVGVAYRSYQRLTVNR